MFKSWSASKANVVRFGGREIITEGLHLSFWADISHRCLTASWPSFIGGAVLVFIAFNAMFASFYWIGNQPISNVPGGAYIDVFCNCHRYTKPKTDELYRRGLARRLESRTG